jgi:hypothetical protein
VEKGAVVEGGIQGKGRLEVNRVLFKEGSTLRIPQQATVHIGELKTEGRMTLDLTAAQGSRVVLTWDQGPASVSNFRVLLPSKARIEQVVNGIALAFDGEPLKRPVVQATESTAQVTQKDAPAESVTALKPQTPATDAEAEQWTYQVLADGTVKVLSCMLPKTVVTVEVPSQIKGRAVTVLGSGLLDGYRNVVTMTLPKRLRTIETGCFAHMEALKEVTFPRSLVMADDRLGRWSFQDCKQLEKVVFEGTPELLPQAFFSRCEQLSEVLFLTGNRLPRCDVASVFDAIKGEVSIALCAINKVYNVKNGKIVESKIKKVSGEHIQSWHDTWMYRELGTSEVELVKCKLPKKSQSIVVPKRINGRVVTVLRENLLADYTNTTSVTLPDTIKTIGRFCFARMKKLQAIVLPEALVIEDTLDAEGAFQGCSKLKSVTFSSKVEILPKHFFADCTGLEGVTILNGTVPKVLDSTTFSGVSRGFFFEERSTGKFYTRYGEERTIENLAKLFGFSKLPESAFQYEAVEDGVAIVNVNVTNSERAIFIPATLGGKPVRRICSGAFASFVGRKLFFEDAAGVWIEPLAFGVISEIILGTPHVPILTCDTFKNFPTFKTANQKELNSEILVDVNGVRYWVGLQECWVFDLVMGLEWVTLPQMCQGKPVRGILPGAFRGKKVRAIDLCNVDAGFKIWPGALEDMPKSGTIYWRNQIDMATLDLLRAETRSEILRLERRTTKTRKGR